MFLRWEDYKMMMMMIRSVDVRPLYQLEAVTSVLVDVYALW